MLQQLELFDRHHHGPRLRAFARPDDAALLEQVHQPPGARKADLQLALQHRGRAELAAHHELHRLTQQRLVLVLVAAGRAEQPAAVATFVVTLDAADVDHLGRLTPPMGNDLAHFFLADERALDALRDVGVPRQQQHVALADQLLGARLVEDDAAVGETVDGIGGTSRDVGLDHAGDHVDRRTLRGDDQVHAHGTRLLSNTGDALLHVTGGDHHQVIELVDDDDDVRQPLELAIRPRLRLQLAAVVRGVVPGDVAEPDLEQQVVTALHLLDRPTQRVGGLLRVRHRLGQQVGQLVVLAHFDLLRVDEDEAHLVGCAAHEDRRQDAVEAAGLAGARGAGDQQVRRGGQVEEDRPAGDVFADRHIERVGGRLGLRRRHDVAQADELAGVVRHLDTDRRTPGDGGEDAHVGGGHRVRNVAVEAGDPGDLHARTELELVARDGGADGLAEELGLDAVRRERIDQRAAASLDLGLVDRLLRRAVEIVGLRQHPLPSLRAGTELELGLLDEAGIERARRRQRARRLGLARLGRLVPILVERSVVQHRHGKFSRALAIALQGRHVAERGPGSAPDRHGDCADTFPGVRQHGPQRRAGQHQRSADAGRDQHHDRTARGDEAAQRLTDEGADPAARPAQCLEVGHDLLGTAHDVQQPQERQTQEPPPDRQPESPHALALADQRCSDGDQRDRHDEPSEPCQPTNDRLDTTTERPGEVEIDRQAQQHAGGDEADAGELVLASLDGLAQLGRRLVSARRRGRRCHRRRLGRCALGSGR